MSEFNLHCKQETMSRVLEVRYTDLQEEKSLCSELLRWADESGDAYAAAFAHTYLGDYYVAMSDSGLALFHLKRAGSVIKAEGRDWLELKTRYLFFTALGHELQSDDQNAVSYYMESVALAHKIGDIDSESMILNNVGFILQRHHCFPEALDYYRNAYRLCENNGKIIYTALVLCNLAELLIESGHPAEGEAHMLSFEAMIEGREELIPLRARIRCRHHAARGEAAPTLEWMNWVVEHLEEFESDQLTAFDQYTLFCECALMVGSQEYSLRFLELMEASCNGKLHHLKPLEEHRMNYARRFLPPEELDKAYEHYYLKTTDLRKLSNQSVVAAMNAKISLNQALLQKDDLQSVQEQLEAQANLDELTQIHNRRYLDQLVREHTDSCMIRPAAIMLDVDYFKEYNDFYGHLKGDEVLRVVGACLWENRVEGISPCRYGGDEFACLCAGVEPEQVEAYIRAVRTDLARRAIPHERSRCAGTVTLSVGYALGEAETCCDPALLLQLADQALYSAKVSGRNTYARKQVSEV